MDGILSMRRRDENNNLLTNTEQKENIVEIDEEVSRCCHSKFCFTRDVSEKEESLLRTGRSDGNTDAASCLTNANRKPCKKFVTFDRSAPMLIAPDNDDSDVDVPLGRGYKTFCGDFDTSSDSESISPSESEVFATPPRQTENSVKDQSDIISKSEEKLTEVLRQLQRLTILLDIQEDDSQTPNLGGTNLLQMVDSIALIADQLVKKYRTHGVAHVNASPTTADPDRLSNLQSKNNLLEEELKNAKNKIQCLETEITYFSKESALLNREVKEMAFKMAASGIRGEASEKAGTDGNYSTEAEIYYKNPHHQRHFDSFDSKSSARVDASQCFNYCSTFKNTPRNFETVSGNGCESQTELFVHKRENEMNALIRDKNTNNCGLHAQIQIHDERLENWKKLQNATNEEKQQMLEDLVKVVQEHKAVLKERDHFEFLLKLMIEEKGNFDFDVKNLLQNLVIKLQESPEESGSWIQTSLLEGAVKALQQQNGTQREEIYRLKHLLSEAEMQTQCQAIELDDCSKKIEHLLDELSSHDAKLKVVQDDSQIKCDKIQNLCNDAVAAKTVLEKRLMENEEGRRELCERLRALKKSNKRHHKKSQELQKNNLLIVKEIKESKGNMDFLSELISQLRSSLKDQKSEWNERLRASSEEASQNKQQCEWLKCQADQLTQQLQDALDRLKMHDMDKVQLGQQLLLAEEERRVVDRKLQELRTALQGDTGLREALIERNETLQIEINRLRLAKTNNLQTAPPPMEMRQNNGLFLSSALLPPTENHHYDKHPTKKNCYTENSRRTNDVPRTAVSLHNGGTK